MDQDQYDVCTTCGDMIINMEYSGSKGIYCSIDCKTANDDLNIDE